MQQLTPEISRCLWTGIAIILHSFLCTLLRTGITTLTFTEVTRFYRYHPHTARRLDYLKKRPTLTAVTISTLHICGIAAGIVWIFPVLPHIAPSILHAGTALFILSLVIFGSLIPQALGTRFSEPVCFILVHPFTIITWLISPFTFPLAALGRIIGKPKPYSPEQIIADLKLLAQTAKNEKVISAQQAHLITRSVDLSEITAADIMVKRSGIKAISDKLTLSEALIEAHLHHHTRFPLVHDNDLDQIIGYVNFKDIVGALSMSPGDPSLAGIRRPLESVPVSVPLPELLQQLTRGFQHMVIVTDQMNSTLGIVTLEDLMETLVGNLEDEYDNPPDFVVKLGENRYCAGGGTSFSTLRQKVSSQLPDWDLTVAEWITGLTKGDLPDGFSSVYKECTFTVRKIARGKVFDVIVDRATQKPS